MKKEIAIFDLYDTVLSNEYFVFENGLKYLYKTFFTGKCSFDDFIKTAESFLPLYEKRKTDNIEICLIRDELPFIFEKYGVDFPKDIYELEYTVMNEMQKVSLPDDVRETLEELQNAGVKMFILSNSIFTGRVAEKLLESFGILRYFEIYSLLVNSLFVGIDKSEFLRFHKFGCGCPAHNYSSAKRLHSSLFIRVVSTTTLFVKKIISPFFNTFV